MKIGIIGCGNMASFIIDGLKSKKEDIEFCIYDIDKNRMNMFSEKYNANPKIDEKQVVVDSDIIILAVKPKDIIGVLNNVKDEIDNKIIISIAAGIKIESLKRILGDKKIIRVMPNINISVQKGILAMTYINLNNDEIIQIEELLNLLGNVYTLSEKYFDLITALIGSGPAFIALFIEALCDGALKLGLSKDISLKMILDLIEGTIINMKINNYKPQDIRDFVSSPGGTTIEGLLEMEKNGAKAAIIDGLIKAYEKSIELGK